MMTTMMIDGHDDDYDYGPDLWTNDLHTAILNNNRDYSKTIFKMTSKNNLHTDLPNDFQKDLQNYVQNRHPNDPNDLQKDVPKWY